MNDSIILLQKMMQKSGIHAYLIPTSDDHHSEYISDFFKCRQYFSGFTGSAGTLLVTQTDAYLWTDGRYFLQAAQQLEGSGIQLMKAGTTGTPTIGEFLQSTLSTGNVLGFDGKLYTVAEMEELQEKLLEKQIVFRSNCDLAGEIWTDRPPLSKEKAHLLPLHYAGISVEDKLAGFREHLIKHHCSCQILNSLTDIAWLFNLRGKDVSCTPVALAYAIITLGDAKLFLQDDVLSQEDQKALQELGVTLLPYEQYYEEITKLSDTTMLLDKADLNYHSYEALSDSITFVLEESWITGAKIVKSDIEIENTKQCHLRDAIYVTKFIHWIKKEVKKRPLTELEATNYIDTLRLSDPLALDLSFDTISAYGANAAIVHYSADEESNAVIEPKGMLLVDSGGHYYDGTTDITRTILLGPVSEEEKRCFTAVCISMLHLANAKFLSGCRGSNLDILARQPIWKLGLDYRHGTGHGVGHILSVHEGPNSFRFRTTPSSLDAILKPGMITTDEPGLYMDGRFGIRTENELLCTKWKQNEYGQFLQFEPLTLVPIDLDGILPELMEPQEKEWLNAYHQTVYETIAPHLTEEEQIWLKSCTAPIE